MVDGFKESASAIDTTSRVGWNTPRFFQCDPVPRVADRLGVPLEKGRSLGSFGWQAERAR